MAWDGTGLQPFSGFGFRDLGRCPRLGWQRAFGAAGLRLRRESDLRANGPIHPSLGQRPRIRRKIDARANGPFHAVRPLEHDSARRQPVDVRRLDQLVAVAAERRLEVVDANQQHIRLGLCGGRAARSDEIQK